MTIPHENTADLSAYAGTWTLDTLHCLERTRRALTMNSHSARSTTALAVAILLAFTVQSYAQTSSTNHQGVATINADTSTQAPQVARQGAAAPPAFSKQHVDGGDLLPDTIFTEKYERQSVPASR